jgi:mRNA interferase MazF
MRDARTAARVPRLGELYWADLDPVVGTELGRKVRPVVVVSVDGFNQGGEKVVVVPGTTVQRDLPTRVAWRVNSATGPRETYLCCEDIRAISTQRLRGRIGSGVLPERVMEGVSRVLVYLFGLRHALAS